MNELAIWLVSLRRDAKLSLAALSEKTKIMVKYLEALEKGDLEGLPTKMHARAFALAFARACGADEDEAVQRVGAALSSKAPVAETPQAVAAAVAPGAVREAPAPVILSQALPWKQWGLVAAASVAFLMALHGAVSCVRGRVKPEPAIAPAESVTPLAISATAQVENEELALRARRPCWVLLAVDGKRLPVVFLEPDKRERWMVGSKAVMLAGNIGAVRVWWRGDNLGYFGELGERMNGIVFETGKPWRKDPAEDLALPPGAPSQARK